MSAPGHVILVGLMGAGKTTVGKALAQRLGRPFLDSDDLVVSRTGHTVREIFEADGEAAFRELETQVLADALGEPTPAVVAAAGGTVLRQENRRLMGEAGLVVWLRGEPAVLAARAADGEHRPLLDGDPVGVLARLAEERDALYGEVADVVVDVGEREPADIVEELAVQLAQVGS